MANPDAATLGVEARASAAPDGGLQIFVRYRNTGKQPVYAFDRLWTLSPASEIVVDPALAYRFVSDDTLQVLLGLAPLPSRKTTLYRNVPYATRIEPGQIVERRLEWKAPVAEYSVYFPEGDRPHFEKVRVKKLVVLVDSVVEPPDLQTIAAPFDPKAFKLNRAGIHSLALRAASPEVPISFTIQKRTDEFDRIRADAGAR